MNAFVSPKVQELLSQPVEHFQALATAPSDGRAPRTNVAFLLDCSGSMQMGKSATLEGYNAQVEVIRAGAKDVGETTYTDVHFASEVHLRSVAVGLEQLTPLTEATYQPAGNTALLDAMGATVAALLETEGINSPETATLVTVFTDGRENASRVYSVQMIRNIILRLEATGRWTFALVGPRQTVTALARVLTIRPKNVTGFDVESIEDKRAAFSKVALANERLMAQRKRGVKQFDDLFDDMLDDIVDK